MLLNIRPIYRFFMSTNSNVRFRRNRAIVAISGIAAILSLPLTTSAHDAPEFTGVVIDVRAIAAIDRSPAPVIYGPLPTSDEVYPDPTCVPTPDQVQDQSVVRYYHTEEDAEKGAAGDHPIILKAEAVVGPAHDSVRLSADDAAHLKTLDKTMHYTHTWKVAFLIPENR